MNKPLVRLAWRGALAVFAMQLLTSVSFAALASLGDWAGDNNAPPDPGAENNNYVVTSQTSAGGQFQARRTKPLSASPDNKAFLSDPTLKNSSVGLSTAYGFNEDFSATGTLTFTNPNNLDPNFFFGFYAGAGLASTNTQRLGLAFADSGVNFFRAQGTARGSTTLTTTNTLTTTGAAPSPANGPTAMLAAGTYPFSFSYVASTRLFSASVGPNFRNVTLPVGYASADPDALTRFGFIQFGDQVVAAPPNPQPPFTFTISDINYSGNSLIPEPATGMLLGLGMMTTAFGVRRKRRIS